MAEKMRNLKDVKIWAESVGLKFTVMGSGFGKAYELSLNLGEVPNQTVLWADNSVAAKGRREFIRKANLFREWYGGD